MSKFKDFLSAAGETIFPRAYTCDICGRETFGTNLCPDCEETVIFNDGATCPVCGRKTVRAEICLECKDRPPLYKKAFSPVVYDGGGKILMAKFKNGNGYLKEFFADITAEKLKNSVGADCIVAVPMTDDAKRARGYNQSVLLAESLSNRIGIPVIKNAVIKVKSTEQQKHLTKKERTVNLESCFKITDKTFIAGKNILIVDDVMTTGATADALTKKLLRAGAKNVFVATVMSVEYRQFKDKKLF